MYRYILYKTINLDFLWKRLKDSNDSPWRIPSEKAGSWMAFFKKFSIDFNRAALWGIHCIPREQESWMMMMIQYNSNILFFCVCLPFVPARGVLAAPLCARWSGSGLEPEDVDGPGLLSIATSDTVRIHNVGKSILLNFNLSLLTNSL